VKLDAQQLVIPFKHSFSHASATRQETEAVLVKAVTSSGAIGYGEGCPRSYVTGETLQSVMRFFDSFKGNCSQLDDLEHVIAWQAQHANEIDQNPSAWCAMECALLDALSRESGCSIEAFLSLTGLSGAFNYTAVLGAEGMKTFAGIMAMYQQVGFTDYKLKISGNLELDQEKIAFLKSHCNYRIRLDGNNFWQDVDEASTYINALNCEFVGVEEPLVAQAFVSMRRLSAAIDTKIILDESFLTLHDFARIADEPQYWIINLRVSKMGGILRSLKVAQKAVDSNIGLIIGAQVGESSILTRAALTVASEYKEHLISQEGAFGTHLLEHDVTNNPISFGLKGKLDVVGLGELPGFGIEYNL